MQERAKSEELGTILEGMTMGKSHRGDQIVAKVRQASCLIEQGKPLREVWASVQISRQTYNHWKGICDSIQSELESQTKQAAKQIDSFREENRKLKIILKKVRDQVCEYKRQLKVADQRLSIFSDLQGQLTKADNARRSSEKVIEDLKAQLSKTEEKLQERIAANEVLQHQYEQSEEHSRKSTEQSEQEKIRPANLSDSENESIREDGDNSLTRSNSQDRDDLSEDPAFQNMNLSSKNDLDETREDAIETKHRLGGERATRMFVGALSDTQKTTGRSSKGAWFAKHHRNMKGLSREQVYPIGIDIEDECITMVQLGASKEGISVIQAKKVESPYGIEPDNNDWGRWAVHAIKDSIRSGGFRNRKVCLALPVRDTFMDNMSIPSGTLDYATIIFEGIQRKLPYKATRENTIIKWVPTEGSHVIAIALERKRVEQCLAICEKTQLKPETFSVWPFAMISSYSLQRTQTDSSFVMLVDVATNHTNVVICRGKTLYYAHSIHVGARDLEAGTKIRLLTDYIDSCRKHFKRIYGNRLIKRSIFFVGKAVDRDTIVKIATQVGIPAQLCDPFEVIKVSNCNAEGANFEKTRSSWIAAIGVGLGKRTSQFASCIRESKSPGYILLRKLKSFFSVCALPAKFQPAA